MNVPWTIWDVVLGSVAVLGSVFIFLVAVSLAVNGPEGDRDWVSDGDFIGIPAPMVLALVLETFFLVAVFLFAVAKRGAPVRRLGFVQPSGRRPYVLALGAWMAGLAALLVWAGITEIIGIELFKIPEPPGELVDYSGVRLAFPLIVVGLFGPFCEEVFFRGFALPAFASRFGLRGGILISAILFSVFHFSIGSAVPIFIFGVVLAWLYVRTGSLYPSIVAHATQNIVATLLTT